MLAQVEDVFTGEERLNGFDAQPRIAFNVGPIVPQIPGCQLLLNGSLFTRDFLIKGIRGTAARVAFSETEAHAIKCRYIEVISDML